LKKYPLSKAEASSPVFLVLHISGPNLVNLMAAGCYHWSSDSWSSEVKGRMDIDDIDDDDDDDDDDSNYLQ